MAAGKATIQNGHTTCDTVGDVGHAATRPWGCAHVHRERESLLEERSPYATWLLVRARARAHALCARAQAPADAYGR